MDALFNDLIGESLGVFLGLGIVLFGGCAWMTGQALARTWRPVWLMAPAGIGLALGERFLDFALFGGVLLSVAHFLTHAAILIGLGVVSYRLAMAHQMTRQYPWLYERASVFSWRDKT